LRDGKEKEGYRRGSQKKKNDIEEKKRR
jgi:hypothetical protein